jgi:hypothetical protein
MSWVKRIAAAALAVAMIGLYADGVFDAPLSNATPIPLNAHDCGVNGFGQTLCGRSYEMAKAERDKAAAAKKAERAADEDGWQPGDPEYIAP